MYKREYKNTGDRISLLGLGCMRLPKIHKDKPEIDVKKAQEIIDYAYNHGINYFDTAYPYHNGQSELVVGEALKKYPRNSFYLADKFPIWEVKNEEDVQRIFNEQLKKCQVDYFDFYLCHAMNKERIDVYKKFHVFDFLQTMKEQGKIKRFGFSFHDTPEVLRQLCKVCSWDFAQIQLNYLDWEMQDAKSQYEILESNGIPTVVMEPVRGGALADLCEEANKIFKDEKPEASVASWAIRYVASLPNILCVLSGMSNMEQIIDNVNTMENFTPLTKEEYKIVEMALDTYKKKKTIPCTGCRYCMDCSSGVDIPKVFKTFNNYALDGGKPDFIYEYDKLTEENKAHNCIACKQCVGKCPQHINIPEKMEKIKTLVEDIRKEMN